MLPRVPRKLVLLGAAAAIAVALWDGSVTDHLWFKLQRSEYVARVGDRDLVIFRWSEVGSLGGYVRFAAVVFDRSGEIVRPIDQRTEGWISGYLKECSTSVACAALEESPE